MRWAALALAFAVVAAAALLVPRGPLRGCRALAPAADSDAVAMLVEIGALAVVPRPSGQDGGLLAYAVPGGPVPVLPSTTAGMAVAAANPDLDLLSVVLARADWDGPRGIKTNPLERGPAWQRGACVSLFAGGTPVAATTCGIAVHGDTSRASGDPSLQLLLTPGFGGQGRADSLLPGVGTASSLVVRNEGRHAYAASPIALELAALCGNDVPRSRQVRLLVNGEPAHGTWFLTERVDAEAAARRAGRRHVLAVQEKPRSGEKAKPYRTQQLRLLRQNPARHARAAEDIDVDAVVDWLAVVLFCNVYDAQQGIAWLDPAAPAPRWRWILWDLDWAFGEWPAAPTAPTPSPGNAVQDYVRPADSLRSGDDLRRTLLAKLVSDDPEFRSRLLARITEVLNHTLAPDVVAAVLSRHREAAARYAGGDALASLARTARFLRERPARLCRELADAFGIDDAFQVRIDAPGGTVLWIDGHRHVGPYHGRYFRGQRLQVRPEASVRLRVDGAGPPTPTLDRPVTADLAVEVLPE